MILDKSKQYLGFGVRQNVSRSAFRSFGRPKQTQQTPLGLGCIEPSVSNARLCGDHLRAITHLLMDEFFENQATRSFAVNPNQLVRQLKMWYIFWCATCILVCIWSVWFLVDLMRKRREIDGLVNCSSPLCSSWHRCPKWPVLAWYSSRVLTTSDPAPTAYAEQAFWPPLHSTGIKETFPPGLSWPGIC